MNITIHKYSPKDIIQWNLLAEENDNLLQSTYYDDIQSFFHLKPAYIEVTSGGNLIGGVKLYMWSSDKLGKVTVLLSKTITQFGEIILKRDRTEEEKNDIINYINKTARNFIIEERAVTFQIGGFYGDSTLLLDYENLHCEKSALFNVSNIDLTLSIEQLWERIHLKHKQSIKKAEKSNLEFNIEDNIDIFIDLMKETYRNNESLPPNFDYIKHAYEVLSRKKMASLFFVKQDNQYLSGAFNTLFGKGAYYAFGGNRKNPLGSGVWLHWKIMKYYRDNGVLNYCLGQVARDNMSDNVKFTQGISPFKRRFGVIEKKSFSKRMILKQTNRKVWRIILGIRESIKL